MREKYTYKKYGIKGILAVVLLASLVAACIDAAKRNLAIAYHPANERLTDFNRLHARDIDTAEIALEKTTFDFDARSASACSEIAERDGCADNA